MGTSSIYGGPTNSNPKDNPLLPDDFDFNEDTNQEEDDIQLEENPGNEEEEKQVTDVGWKDAKTYMSKLATGKYSNTRRAISNHIKAYGGSKAASKTARAGIKTTINLGSFANRAIASSFGTVLEEFKIDYFNKSPREVLNELINLIAPVPVTKDDSIARKALIVTLEYIYEMFDEENIDYDSIDKNSLNLMVPKYIENYIYERIINDLGSRIEYNSGSSVDAINTENDLKEYINAKVDVAFRGKDFSQINFNDATTQNQVESLINQCYTLMEE